MKEPRIKVWLARDKDGGLNMFLCKPHRPVELMVTISMRETTRLMPAAARGPKRKPAMQTMTSFRSKFRKPSTFTGISLERYITT